MRTRSASFPARTTTLQAVKRTAPAAGRSPSDRTSGRASSTPGSSTLEPRAEAEATRPALAEPYRLAPPLNGGADHRPQPPPAAGVLIVSVIRCLVRHRGAGGKRPARGS